MKQNRACFVKRRFRQEFGCHSSQVPSNTEIHRFVSHFEREGSVLKQAKGRSGRIPEVTGDGDRIEQVRQSVSESSRTSYPASLHARSWGWHGRQSLKSPQEPSVLPIPEGHLGEGGTWEPVSSNARADVFGGKGALFEHMRK